MKPLHSILPIVLAFICGLNVASFFEHQHNRHHFILGALIFGLLAVQQQALLAKRIWRNALKEQNAEGQPGGGR